MKRLCLKKSLSFYKLKTQVILLVFVIFSLFASIYNLSIQEKIVDFTPNEQESFLKIDKTSGADSTQGMDNSYLVRLASCEEEENGTCSFFQIFEEEIVHQETASLSFFYHSLESSYILYLQFSKTIYLNKVLRPPSFFPIV
jgi:hypothetical protein